MRLNRLAVAWAAAIALVAMPAGVAAHADLESSTPEPGANLESAPTEVALTFSGELDPASGFVVTDGGGAAVGEGELDLDVADRNVLRGPVDITEPGTYTVAWTAVSADGHAEEGTFEFGFQADASAAATGGDRGDDAAGSPDTAMPVRTSSGESSVLGVLLLATAIAVALGRTVRERSA